MRVENLLDFNKIIPQKWKSVCQNINITGYQTISNFDDYSGITITGDNIIIFFYSGELIYDYTEAKHGVEIINAKANISFGTTEFGKKKNSRWIIVITPKYLDKDITHYYSNSIEGLLKFVLGCRLVLAKVFTKILDVNNFSYSLSSHSILNPNMLGPKLINNISMITLDNAIESIDKLNKTNKEKYYRSLKWFNDAFSDTDKWDSFIKIWIAIEMAFIEKEKACNVLKDIMVKAFKMNHQEINKYFMINHIYGLRKKIIHNGYFPNFDHRLLELLGNIYRDLLSWKLSGICPKSSLLYLENNEIVISELFKDSLKK